MNDKPLASAQEIRSFDQALIDSYEAVISVRLEAIAISTEFHVADLYRSAIADDDYEIVRLLDSMVVEVERDLTRLTAKSTDSMMSDEQRFDLIVQIADANLCLEQLMRTLEKAKVSSKTAASTMTTLYLIDSLKKITSEIDMEKSSVRAHG